jgi:hypothetical protein
VEEPDKWKLQLDFGTLADIALPSELCSIVSESLCALCVFYILFYVGSIADWSFDFEPLTNYY